MPLSDNGSPDLCIWRGDRSGIFSVRSGYRWLTNSTDAYSNDPISMEETWYNKFLGSVWALKLPSKIKIHFWRVINNFIPTFSNLVTRKISVQTQCLLCQSESESVSHLVKGCSFAQQILSELGILTCPWQTKQSFASWLSAAFKSLNSTARRTFVVALWAIWGSRNKIIHEGLVQSVREVANFCRIYIMEIDASLPSSLNTSTHPDSGHWNPPPVDRVKVNFDACFDPTRLHSISSILIRNSEGKLLAACTIPNLYVMNPEMAEALACDQALILSMELGLKRIEVEGDALVVISKVVNPVIDISTLGTIYSNILKKRRNFDFLSFSHIYRINNNTAHVLARVGKQNPQVSVWFEEAPQPVEEAVMRDNGWFNPMN
ncbi:hypothetical protein V6N12_046171 [Hibiscus sabdariffa]|uniref:Reverse transcriptase zinc-binding domain n=1 Tax=Hibiscus sabdariffa TaxID=183260 RepID=A0ABR2B6S6_9ROSI